MVRDNLKLDDISKYQAVSTRDVFCQEKWVRLLTIYTLKKGNPSKKSTKNPQMNFQEGNLCRFVKKNLPLHAIFNNLPKNKLDGIAMQNINPYQQGIFSVKSTG